MSNPLGALPRSGSESSFLLIHPLPSEDASSSFLPSERSISSNGWALYILPALAVIDLGSSVLLGTAAAFRDDWRLTGWGCIRAVIVFWVGWAGKRGIRGGGGWLAGTTMITILLAFWHLNILFLTRPSDDPPCHLPNRYMFKDRSFESDDLASINVTKKDHRNHDSLQELSGLKILAPRIGLSIFSVLIALTEELVHTRIARMYGTGDAFVIRRPRQIPSPFPHSQQSIPAHDDSTGLSNFLHPNHSSYYFRSLRGHNRFQVPSDEADPFFQPTTDRGLSSDFSSGTAATTMTATGTVDQLEHDYEPSDDSSDEFSDSEIVDIPPRSSMYLVLGGGMSRGGLERDVDSLDRCLSRSFSRRRLRSSTVGSNPFDREELAVGYGTFGE
ncbi:hypothetical protein [Phaffia rhodozyma]|uniref:Uncharacterized protein n=1 Tax=Phaffia rhodozyma TaxID=264483 RepID=A0A0F7SGZ3_PHARH|nr:hypothetical protein [Phaffia rhodozyma]